MCRVPYSVSDSVSDSRSLGQTQSRLSIVDYNLFHNIIIIIIIVYLLLLTKFKSLTECTTLHTQSQTQTSVVRYSVGGIGHTVSVTRSTQCR